TLGFSKNAPVNQMKHVVEHHRWRALCLLRHSLEFHGYGWCAQSLSHRSLQMSLCPASPSLQWVPWDVGSPPASVLCSATTAHGPPRGRSVLPLLPRALGGAPLTLSPFVSQSSCERRALPFHAGSLSHAGRHSCA